MQPHIAAPYRASQVSSQDVVEESVFAFRQVQLAAVFSCYREVAVQLPPDVVRRLSEDAACAR